MKVLETDRMVLRRLTADDAAFIHELVNEPSWLQHIGDKGVRTLDDARTYILNGPVAMYERVGIGLLRTDLKEDGSPIGICGLIRRDTLPDVDIGLAFLPRFWGRGYALEAAKAVLEHGRSTLGLKRVVAITSLENHPSMKLLEKIGFKFEKRIQLSAGGEEVTLFALHF